MKIKIIAKKKTKIITGISISKSKLILENIHINTLNSLNIGIYEDEEKYILFYKPSPHMSDKAQLCLLKGILIGIRYDEIYNSYNDDFGDHEIN